LYRTITLRWSAAVPRAFLLTKQKNVTADEKYVNKSARASAEVAMHSKKNKVYRMIKLT
jgi:hypothetical protein